MVSNFKKKQKRDQKLNSEQIFKNETLVIV